MNRVELIGRLTRDPEVRYTSEGKVIARFTLAIDRFGSKEKQTDFPSVVAFGRTGEIVDKYVRKGHLLGVEGRLQTGSYEKDGTTVYTTDVIADRVQLLTPKDTTPAEDDIPSGYSKLDDDSDIPF